MRAQRGALALSRGGGRAGVGAAGRSVPAGGRVCGWRGQRPRCCSSSSRRGWVAAASAAAAQQPPLAGSPPLQRGWQLGSGAGAWTGCLTSHHTACNAGRIVTGAGGVRQGAWVIARDPMSAWLLARDGSPVAGGVAGGVVPRLFLSSSESARGAGQHRPPGSAPGRALATQPIIVPPAGARLGAAAAIGRRGVRSNPSPAGLGTGSQNHLSMLDAGAGGVTARVSTMCHFHPAASSRRRELALNCLIPACPLHTHSYLRPWKRLHTLTVAIALHPESSRSFESSQSPEFAHPAAALA
jgi:hypothetical protein